MELDKNKLKALELAVDAGGSIGRRATDITIMAEEFYTYFMPGDNNELLKERKEEAEKSSKKSS